MRELLSANQPFSSFFVPLSRPSEFAGPPLDGMNAAPQLDPQELADKLLITLAECDR